MEWNGKGCVEVWDGEVHAGKNEEVELQVFFLRTFNITY